MIIVKAGDAVKERKRKMNITPKIVPKIIKACAPYKTVK
jgi:hypothetical protein